MAAEFELKITEVKKLLVLEATEENNLENDLSEVVVKIRYDYIGNKSEQTYTLPGEVTLSNPSSIDGFVSIEDVTEDIVKGWVNDVSDFNQLETFIEQELDKRISPSIVSTWFDWLPDPYSSQPVSGESQEEEVILEEEENNSEGE